MTTRNEVPEIAEGGSPGESTDGQPKSIDKSEDRPDTADQSTEGSSTDCRVTSDPIDGDSGAIEQETETLLQSLLDQTRDRLEPIAPAQAVELYLEDKTRDCTKATVDAHRSRLGFFVDWCVDQELTNLNDLTARDLHEFRVWRRQDLNVVTERTQMITLRVFVEWCETIDAVETGLFQKVDIPTVDDEHAREEVLHADRAQTVLDYLDTFQYATTEHACWVVLCATGMRLGAVRALDVGDYRPEAESPYIDVCHRPETDTPIKNRARGERKVAIPGGACEVLDDYLQHQRPDVMDEHGREPFLATSHGRVARSTVRKYVYRWSRPCQVGRECPHDRVPDECEAATNLDRAARCPSSVTPHPIRRGYITQLLRAGVPVEVVSDRCDVSPAIIDQHYDVRSETDKMRQRQQVLDDASDDGSPYL